MVTTQGTQEASMHKATLETESAAAPAGRLAQPRGAVYGAMQAACIGAEARFPSAITLLWALLDDAVARANWALEQAGLDERIAVRRTEREYWLGLPPSPDGDERQIAVFVSARAPGVAISGGAHITTSEMRTRIDLIPTAEGGRLRWLIPVTGQELAGPVIDDLLLSVFADDAAATQRLASCYTANERNGGNEG